MADKDMTKGLESFYEGGDPSQSIMELGRKYPSGEQYIATPYDLGTQSLVKRITGIWEQRESGQGVSEYVQEEQYKRDFNARFISTPFHDNSAKKAGLSGLLNSATGLVRRLTGGEPKPLDREKLSSELGFTPPEDKPSQDGPGGEGPG